MKNILLLTSIFITNYSSFLAAGSLANSVQDGLPYRYQHLSKQQSDNVFYLTHAKPTRNQSIILPIPINQKSSILVLFHIVCKMT